VALSARLKGLLLTALLLAVFVGAWHLATLPKAAPQAAESEYSKLVGAQAAVGQKSAFPTPADFGAKLLEHLKDPFYDKGANDKGIGVQLAYSIGRVLLGFLLAALVAVPVGFLIGMSPLVYRALDPFIQVLKPISPLAWMPLALFTLKDSNVSAVFVIFVCSIWPMLINTAFGVASVRREWLNVARTLEVSSLRKAFAVILPAAAPTIMTGMRISIGIAWLVIVAAEMLTGRPGVGGFLWQEYNSLIYSHIILCIITIGVVGFVLDRLMSVVETNVNHILNLPALLRRGVSKLFARTEMEPANALS
jgi:nitrate/nitrite transport system permease protein